MGKLLLLLTALSAMLLTVTCRSTGIKYPAAVERYFDEFPTPSSIMEDNEVEAAENPPYYYPGPWANEVEAAQGIIPIFDSQANKEEFQPLPNVMGANDFRKGGVTYVRWGRPDCPHGAELVYHGRAGGSHYSHSGGGSNYQCLPLDPENFDFGPGAVSHALMYGAEYEMWGNVPKAFLKLHDHDVPCAVCYVKRSALLMIPAKYTCPSKWTREYYGYLMAERHNHHRSTFECVDVNAEPAQGGHPNHNGALFYHVEPRVGSLPGPPYENQKELTCVVCTR